PHRALERRDPLQSVSREASAGRFRRPREPPVKARGREHPGEASDKGRTERAVREAEVIDEIAAEFSTEELIEFLEADLLPVEADPAFRDKLRDELWSPVQRQLPPKR